MKIEIDTDKLNWTEVPGKPTVGSFLSIMQCPPSDAPAAKLPSLYGLVLARVETPHYDYAATGFGLVPAGTQVVYRMFMFPQVIGLAEYPHFGADRIIAYTKDLDRAIDQVINGLYRADWVEKQSLEKPTSITSITISE